MGRPSIYPEEPPEARWQPGSWRCVLKPVPVSCAPSEVGNDAQSERVATNAGEILTEQIGAATDESLGVPGRLRTAQRFRSLFGGKFSPRSNLCWRNRRRDTRGGCSVLNQCTQLRVGRFSRRQKSLRTLRAERSRDTRGGARC